MPMTKPYLVPGTTKKERITSLLNTIKACHTCPQMAKDRKHVVFGVGNINARLLVIGEAPDATDDVTGLPFTGDGGSIFQDLLIKAGIHPPSVYLCYATKCLPEPNPAASAVRTATKSSLDNCAAYLLAQVEIVNPQAIITLGVAATESLLRDVEAPVRGRVYTYGPNRIPVLPNYSVAQLLADPTEIARNQFWDILMEACELAGYEVTRAQREDTVERHDLRLSK